METILLGSRLEQFPNLMQVILADDTGDDHEKSLACT